MSYTVQSRTHGFVLRINTTFDLSMATAATFYYKPVAERGGSDIVQKTAVISDAPNGIVEFTTEADDFVRKGKYSCQLRVDFPTKSLRTKIFTIEAEKSL